MILSSWFILLVIAVHTGVIKSLDLKFFEDFLHFNNLKCVIFIHDLKTLRNIIRHKDMYEFVNKYRVQMQEIPFQNKTIELEKNVYSSSMSRVGIIIPEIEDISRFSHFFNKFTGNKNTFNNTYAWLFDVRQRDIDGQVIHNIFAVQNLNIDTDITLAVDHLNGSKKLFDIYKICHACGTEVLIEEKGIWSLSKGFQLKSHFYETFVRRRTNFKNISLNVTTTFLEKPSKFTNTEYLESHDNKQLDYMQRKTYHLMKNLQTMLNLSFNIKFSDSWDSSTNNKRSVMSMLTENEAEFSLCPLRSTVDRVRLIAFSPNIHTEPICFILRHPRRNVIRNIFLEPLTTRVWWGILFIICLTILLLAFHMQQEYKRQKKLIPCPLERRFDMAILTILEAFFMQGPTPDLFKLTSTRTLIIVTCIFSLLMMQFYSAFIVGSLLSESPHTITNLEALYNSSFDIGMEDIPYNYELLKHSKYPIARILYSNRIMKNPSLNILTLAKGAHRVGSGGFAFYVSTSRAYRFMRNIITEGIFCELQEIYVDPPFQSYAAIAKTSSFREHLANSILLWHMSGITQYNNKHWAMPVIDCSLIKNKEVEVDLEHFLPAIVFLAMAGLLAIIVLMFELIFANFKKRQPCHGKRQH